MPTVIVPAHNEATVIRACLDSLLKQKGVDRIIVACNGCTDDTAAIVQANYPQVTCLDIATPSKVNALNEAEQHVLSWPVFYIDADTKLSDNAVQLITAEMAKGKLLLAAPEPAIDTSHSSWLVKQYYKVWLTLPYIREGVVATCSFVVSAEGRKRFTNFPNVINDDGFVRCQFSADERGNVEGTQVFITAPQNLQSLIKIKTRARLGNMQLAASNLCTKAQEKPYSQILRDKLFSKNFIAVSIYIAIASVIRLRAKQQFKHLSSYRWETDHSSRQLQNR
jgi:glycosyltransferase involved in cell wall biosynthesis